MLQATYTKETYQSLKGKLFSAYKYLLAQDDPANAEKVRQLAQKLLNKEFTIAFCGHFSAGKSKMINNLLGRNLLPSSPIPTSANLVRIKRGDNYAKVFFKKGKPCLYPAPYDYETVKAYCRDGDQIQKIEISNEKINLPSNVVIMDTPGVDSVDDAHRLSTESAIHLADLIFYVMDYNHVKSELNFMFTQNLTKAGKKVCLVINQIDKHSEQEIPFTDFQSGVVEAFAAWGVKPLKIFYTSMKDEKHQHNQFTALKTFLNDNLLTKDQSLLVSVYTSLHKIMADHLALCQEKDAAVTKPLSLLLEGLSNEEKTNLNDDYLSLQKKECQLEQETTELKKSFEKEINKILDNAYLMPFQTRELAKSYLAACQPGFKMGFFFTKRKTYAEKEKRLNLFYADIIEKTKSQIEWHIASFLTNYLQKNRISDSSLMTAIQSLTISFPASLPAKTVKEGARVSDESVTNYTDDVAAEIKHFTKSVITPLSGQILAAVREKKAAQQKQLAQKSVELQKYISALVKIHEHSIKLAKEEEKVDNLLKNDTTAITSAEYLAFASEKQDFSVIKEAAKTEPTHSISPMPQADTTANINLPKTANSFTADKMENMAEKLCRSAATIENLPGFVKLAAELRSKAERLHNKGFTVSLFGAFSAGKSSFANALIGAKVLPVSPNPMTAAINNIKPIDAEHPHETVIAKVKTAANMLADINCALKLFSLQASDLTDAILKIKTLLMNPTPEQTALEKTSLSFLQAFVQGYNFFADLLGTSLKININEFSDYVALEEKSCFIEWLDLYYDCPLTRKGITLVDTPGADSINVRHTDVAFNFIKNADAVLFVTYYNHAFSKADREFLIQLGRVKDSFQLDKMFFIVNAIDLADDEEEKNTVLNYVRSQLIKYGIKKPYLSAVSSLQALKEKMEESATMSSGMDSFEKTFYHFITNDLAEIAVTASQHELVRVAALLQKLINSTQKDDALKKAEKNAVEKQKQLVINLINEKTVLNLQKRLQQENAELIYYVKQRVFYRFNDFFREAFNPAVLRDDRKDLKKALKNALAEFLEQLGFDFAQELRATTLRLDRFAEKLLLEYGAETTQAVQKINPDLSFAAIEITHNAELTFTNAFTTVPRENFSKAMAYFKNAKSFFEKGGSQLMSNELQNILLKYSETYLSAEKEKINLYYDKLLIDELEKIVTTMQEQVTDFYMGLLAVLEDGKVLQNLITAKKLLDKELNC